MNKVELLFQNLQAEFIVHQNYSRAEKMAAYMRNQFQFYGIAAPKRKEIVKYVFLDYKYDKAEFMALAEKLWLHPCRENQYVLFDLGFKWIGKMDLDMIPFFEELLVKKSWWDTVDGIAPQFIGKILLKKCTETEREKKALLWNKSSNIWVIRTSLIFQLHYKDAINFKLVKKLILNRAESKEFFIQKAAGWILRQHAKTNYDEVEEFVSQNNLPNLTKREALK